MTPHDLAAVFLAVEKALKAVLTSAGVRVGKTHDLNVLLKLLADAGIGAPEWLTKTAQLTPFAAILRYIELELDTSVDRDAYCKLAERTLAWATERVGEG